jgi:hypothetical protein
VISLEGQLAVVGDELATTRAELLALQQRTAPRTPHPSYSGGGLGSSGGQAWQWQQGDAMG